MFFALIMSVALLSQNRADSLHRHNHLSGHRLALEGQRQPYEEWFPNQTDDFQQPPVTLHRTMPLEVIDLEIQHQHSLFQHKKRLYEAARRLAGQGPISPWELEQARAELRFHEAQDFERTAYRALDANERGIQDGSNPPDDAREYTLLVDWLRWRRAMAEAKAELRSSRLAALIRSCADAERYSLLGLGRIPTRGRRGLRPRSPTSRAQQGLGRPGTSRQDRPRGCAIPERRSRCKSRTPTGRRPVLGNTRKWPVTISCSIQSDSGSDPAWHL